MNAILTPNAISQSQHMSKEYCATVVRVDEVKPVENSDFLGVTTVQGREIVVRKDTVHEGDVMIYVSNECQLDDKFLRLNNEYKDVEFNANAEEVMAKIAEYDKALLEVGYTEDDERTVAAYNAILEEKKMYVQSHSGYFSKNGRVRMTKLRGTMSMGYLIKPEMMSIYDSRLADFDWSEHVGEDFDCVYGNLFVQAYMPESTDEQHVRGNKRNKRLKMFSRLIPGQFSFHYDTSQLQTNMSMLRPKTRVDISIKLHGTSAIIGNMLVKKPKWGGLYSRFFNWLPSFLQKTVDAYDVVCSSRNVIINSDLYDGKVNVNANGNEQKEIFRWSEKLKGYIPKGMTIYGEIVGYFTGTSTGIMALGGKAFDYGCQPGTNQLMIYRITQKKEDCTEEWNIPQIVDFISNLKNTLKAEGRSDVADGLRIINTVFQGEVKDIFPDLTSSDDFLQLLEPRTAPANENEEQRIIREKHNAIMTAEKQRMYDWMSVENKTINDFISDVVSRDSLIYKAWQNALLVRLKNSKEFLMEQDEPMCRNKLPREGIVVRIFDDPVAEAFKLKCVRFLNKEAQDVDKGKVDSETQARYA